MQPDELLTFLCIVLFAALFAFIWYKKIASSTLSKSHLYDFRNKLLDKFSSAEEIVSFLRTDEGKKLTDSPPSTPPNPLRSVLRYAVWGTISISAGIACFVSSNWYHFSNDINEVREIAELKTWGTMFVMLGIGLLIAAFITNTLIKKWKLNNTNYFV